MFRSSLERLRAWLTLADDVLGDPVAPAHPHRQPLRWRYERPLAIEEFEAIWPKLSLEWPAVPLLGARNLAAAASAGR